MPINPFSGGGVVDPGIDSGLDVGISEGFTVRVAGIRGRARMGGREADGEEKEEEEEDTVEEEVLHFV